jgi:serine/threonine-protein kinase RsbW
VRHSYGNRLDQPIASYFRSAKRCQHGEIESGLEILLCDRGRAIDLNTLRGRPLEQIRPGGLGLPLIRQSMDTVEFTRKGLTNQLRLVEYFAQASDAP